MAFSFIKDAAGNTTGVILDMDAWNYLTRFHSEALYGMGGNTFQSKPGPAVNFFTGEPIDLLGTESFPTEGTEN